MVTCAWCPSGEMSSLTDRYQCLRCGRWTGMHGERYTNAGPYDTKEISPHPEDGPLDLRAPEVQGVSE